MYYNFPQKDTCDEQLFEHQVILQSTILKKDDIKG